MTDLIGRTLGQYRIIEKIGQGGMAVVYKAFQPGLDRYVALKILPPIHAKQSGFKARFQREAKAIAQLNHPNILPVFDFGQDDEYSFIAMRFIEEARTLKSRMNMQGDLPGCVNLIGQIAAALDHAHQQGLIHRDVKPANVLVDGDWALLTDFGLAKMTEVSVKLTGTGVGVGTPAYMSPEQGQGLTVDHRTDIYALGIILFEMLTGQIPHDADTPFAIILKRVRDPLPLPRSINPNIPESVELVILKALAAAPEHRYQTAGQLADALQRAAAGEMVEDARTILSTKIAQPPTAVAAKKEKRSTWLPAKVGLVILALVLLVALGAGAIWSGRIGNDDAQKSPPLQIASLPTDSPLAEQPSPKPTPTVTATNTETPKIEETVVAAEQPSPKPTPAVTATNTETPKIEEATVAAEQPSPKPTPTVTATNTETPKIEEAVVAAEQPSPKPTPAVTVTNTETPKIEETVVAAVTPTATRPVRILYKVKDGETESLFSTDLGGSTPHLLASGADYIYAKLSPNGETVILRVHRDDQRSLYVSSADGSRRQLLADITGHYPYAYFINNNQQLLARLHDGEHYYLEGLDIDGTHPEKIVSGAASLSIRINEGGQKLLIRTKTEDDQVTLYAANGDGSNLQTIADGIDVHYNFSISADGKRLLYFTQHQEKYRLHVHQIDGKQLLVTDAGVSSSGMAIFAPTGDKLLLRYRDEEGGPYHLAVVDVDSGQHVRLLSGDSVWGRFSPNGQWVAAYTKVDDAYRAYVTSIDGAQQQEIIGAEENATWYADTYFSAGGERLLVHVGRIEPYRSSLYVVPFNGDARVTLAENADWQLNASFTPDGKQLVFDSNRDGAPAIYVADADGSNIRKLLDGLYPRVAAGYPAAMVTHPVQKPPAPTSTATNSPATAE